MDGEVVSADSRQVYRYMDIGTAKPTVQERSEVPHHLIDVVDPDQEFSLAVFIREASRAIGEVHARSRLPILAGGTGQYVWGLLEGWEVPEVPPAPELRRTLEERALREGADALHRELAALDPEAAARIDPRNARRVIRALEVHQAGGGNRRPAKRAESPYDIVVIGLTLPRAALYARIDERVERMLAGGWVDEVRGLLARGYDVGLPSLSSLGYAELVRHLTGDSSLETAAQRIKHHTHRFARQQYAWFRLDDERVLWFDGTPAGFERADRKVRSLLGV